MGSKGLGIIEFRDYRFRVFGMIGFRLGCSPLLTVLSRGLL